MNLSEQEGVRVLVVDDNEDAADSLAILLRLWGHEVCFAYDGLSALKMARWFKPEIALLDIQMPIMHGGEVVRLLKQLPGAERITLIATTANDPDDSRLAGYEDVFDAYLIKPFNLNQLERLLAGYAAPIMF